MNAKACPGGTTKIGNKCMSQKRIKEHAHQILIHRLESGNTWNDLVDTFGYSKSSLNRWLKKGIPQDKAIEIIAVHRGEN